MKLDELKYFFEVCECKSFNLAAKNLYISRQSIVRSITNLENELNMPLFSRGYTGVELTDFGKAFYEKSKAAIKVLEELEHFKETYQEQNNQRIVIGIRGKFKSAYRMKKLINAFMEENPEISIETVDGSGVDICNYVEDQRLDLGFTIFEPDMSENLEKIPILEFKQFFLMNRNHRLASEKSIKPEMLDGEKIMIMAFSSIPSMLFRNFLGGKAVPEEIVATVDHGMVYKLLEEPEYISMMMQRDALHSTKNMDYLVMKPTDPPILMKMGLVYNKNVKLSLQKKLFIEYIKHNFSDL